MSATTLTRRVCRSALYVCSVQGRQGSVWVASRYFYHPCKIKFSSSSSITTLISPSRLSRQYSTGPPHAKQIEAAPTLDMENETPVSTGSQHVNSEELSKGKWIALNEITYKDPTGTERKWEAVSRTTKVGGGADAVVIIPFLKRLLKFDCVVLVKQYRPPLKAYSLEFPAGLIDQGEDPLVCAVRELKEETGYTCTPKHTSPGVCLDPGLANSTINMVTVEIDGDEEENRKPVQQQEESEFIEVIPVPVDDLLDTLNRYAKDGVIVHSIVYTYAIALSQMAKPKKVVP